ncbi:hypothetical protein CBR_g3712 [Chara braunii]|uniref:Uncharacterized protein n=1 Tax=Chara braunii TaxID=69332 RepID=A0A388KG27_CHABU|nr:hypothetical protein CBR_g3712 [Chara braunii]|eukprot:GBG69012.1 hypothetical protein CBR_g3712 [Chara braunii]
MRNLADISAGGSHLRRKCPYHGVPALLRGCRVLCRLGEPVGMPFPALVACDAFSPHEARTSATVLAAAPGAVVAGSTTVAAIVDAGAVRFVVVAFLSAAVVGDGIVPVEPAAGDGPVGHVLSSMCLVVGYAAEPVNVHAAVSASAFVVGFGFAVLLALGVAGVHVVSTAAHVAAVSIGLAGIRAACAGDAAAVELVVYGIVLVVVTGMPTVAHVIIARVAADSACYVTFAVAPHGLAAVIARSTGACELVRLHSAVESGLAELVTRAHVVAVAVGVT